MSEVHKSYEEQVKESDNYDEDGYNNYLDYNYEQYPYGNKDNKDNEVE